MTADLAGPHPSARPRVLRGVLLNTGLAASIALALLTGPIAWFGYVWFTFDPAGASLADYKGALTTLLVATAILLAGAAAVSAFRGPRFLHLLAGAGVVVDLALAADCVSGLGSAPAPDSIRPDDFSLGLSLLTAVELPTSWPLLVFVVVAAVRALWSRTRR